MELNSDSLLRKLPGESLFFYELRLGINKKVYGISWQYISYLLNKEVGKKFSEDKWSKEIKNYMTAYENFEESNLGAKKFEEKRLRELEERRKLQAERIDINKKRREKYRRDLIFEKVIKAIDKLPVPEFNPVCDEDNEFDPNSRDGVLAFGDIHFGKEFESLNNKYNIDEAKNRMNDLIEKTIDIVRKEQFSKIKVLNLADSVEGMDLRISQLNSLQIGFIDQVIMFAKLMTSWLNELSKYVKIEYIHVPSANHTEIRPFSSKRGEFPMEDLERVIVYLIHESLKDNDRIDVPINKNGIVELTVAGYPSVALHGHQIKSKKKTNVIKDLSMLYHKFFQYMWMGHFHHGEYLTAGSSETASTEVIQVPSIMGSDKYSDLLGLSAKPGAVFDVFEEGKGRTIQYNITL